MPPDRQPANDPLEVEIVRVDPDEPVITAAEAFGLQDRSWDELQWKGLLQTLVDADLFTWRDVTTLVLGQSNPPQVGTSIASKKTFQRNHPKADGKSTMQQVYDWLYNQIGKCPGTGSEGCGSRLDLQADHVAPIEDAIDDPAKVDTLTNLTLRCRRHNVIRRKSHKLGGRTFLTAEAALMWILLVVRPRTLVDFTRMCRLYGMTMADVRMNEAWAMALWLHRDPDIDYDIADAAEKSLVLRWPNNALTRRRRDDPAVNGAEILTSARSDQLLTFITRTRVAPQVYRVHQMPVGYLPFSHYELGGRPPYALAVLSQRPKTDVVGNLLELPALPPRDRDLIDWKIHDESERVIAEYRAVRGRTVKPFEPSKSRLERKIDHRDADVIRLV